MYVIFFTVSVNSLIGGLMNFICASVFTFTKADLADFPIDADRDRSMYIRMELLDVLSLRMECQGIP